MNAIDIVLVTCVVATAAAYLAWALLGGRTAPPCHNVAPAARGDDAASTSNVIVGASLQRGLDRARQRQRQRARAQ
jgi:hypothetical protein